MNREQSSAAPLNTVSQNADRPRLDVSKVRAGQPRRDGHSYALWVFVAGLAVLAIARTIPYWPLPIPVCGLRALTGFPCPLCGSTRCLIAWSHLDPTKALGFNPLVAIAFPNVVGWFFLAALDSYFALGWTARVQSRAQRLPWLPIIVSAALANWAYLICCLPK
jgi:hypothetical protein